MSKTKCTETYKHRTALLHSVAKLIVTFYRHKAHHISSYLMTQCAITLRLSARLYTNPQAATSRGAGSDENNNHNRSKITSCLGQRGWGDEWGKKSVGVVKRKQNRKGEGVNIGQSGDEVKVSAFLFLYISAAPSVL